ncbi:Zinc knuckle CX2CX4HX4C [Parasponia andersonii]|uniref:Zinc knuckle CX2CX4HX4C n=1 Tax=Parasponia andersonii TaxID=3476 RepID=A0A2P5E2P8_PARAD|nr:Zinc knuckle CX2CX4HX4C [Parasponia andersonii]
MILKSEFGHFTRILIDTDLSQLILDSLIVEVRNDCLFILLEYERLHAFCSSCKIVGHDISSCRRSQKLAAVKELDSKVYQSHSLTRKQVYRPIIRSPVNPEVPITNEFLILKKDLAAEVQKSSETLMGKKKIWTDDVEETLEVED